MSTIIIALCVVGLIALIVAILLFVQKRDQKAEATMNRNIS